MRRPSSGQVRLYVRHQDPQAGTGGVGLLPQEQDEGAEPHRRGSRMWNGTPRGERNRWPAPSSIISSWDSHTARLPCSILASPRCNLTRIPVVNYTPRWRVWNECLGQVHTLAEEHEDRLHQVPLREAFLLLVPPRSNFPWPTRCAPCLLACAPPRSTIRVRDSVRIMYSLFRAPLCRGLSPDGWDLCGVFARRRAKGDLQAVATLSTDQREMISSSEKV